MRSSFAALSTISVLTVLLPTDPALADWTALPGPHGIRINVLYKVGSVTYAGTETRGVYRSTNDGADWQASNTGIENTRVSDIIVSRGHLLAAVLNSCGIAGVYSSTDGGDHWLPTAGLAHPVRAFGIKNNVIYAAAFDLDGSIYRSSDDGSNWQQVASPIQGGEAIIISGNAIIVSESNFIWRSTDDGVSWDVVEQFALSGVKAFAQSGNRILGAGVTVLYVSTNNGVQWEYSPFAGGALSLTASASTVFLGGGNRVSKSTDSGLTWSDASSGLGRGDIDALIYDGAKVVAATPGDTSGVYVSANGGASWLPSAAGLPAAKTIRAVIALGQDLFVGTEGDGVYRSSDQGNTWVKVGLNNLSLVHQLVVSFCVKGDMLFAGTDNGVFRSTDHGETFETIVNGFPTGGTIFVPSLTVSGNRLVAAGNISYATSGISAIFTSSDDGASWHQSSFPAASIYMSAVASDGSDTVFVGSYGESFSTTGLHRSTNQGLTWTWTGSLMADIERLAINGANVLAGTLFSAFYSIDGGDSFAGSSPVGGGIFAYALIDDFVFAGNQLGMSYSVTRGASWIDANQGFAFCPRPSVEQLCVNAAYLFAGTFNNGLWRRPLSDFGITGIAESAPSVPHGYWLSQNYPNPANPMTAIEFAIPRSQQVLLRVFDVLGRDVATVAAGEMGAGEHRYEWNASGLASGVYYYRLEAGDFTATRKLIVVK